MYKHWTNAWLIKEAKALYEFIYIVDCFGTNDLLRLDLIERELYGRGIELGKGDVVKC